METAALFAFGTLWFWLLIIAVSILMFIYTEFEKGLLATITVIAAIIAIHVWGGKTLLVSISEHPWRTLQYAGIYLILGTIWGISKWWAFVKRQRRKYGEALDIFKADFKKPGAAESWRHRTPGYGNQKDTRNEETLFKEAWKSCVETGAYKENSFEFKPDPKKHKSRILIWMTYWPWSFLWTMLNDPFKAAYYRVLGLLKKISVGAFKDVGDPLLEEGGDKK